MEELSVAYREPIRRIAARAAALPTAGRYLAAVDEAPADGQVLTLNLVGATPATPGAFTSVVGGAVINWPPAAPAVTLCEEVVDFDRM